MANKDLQTDSTSRMSDFSFGLFSSGQQPQYEEAAEQTVPKPQGKRHGSSTLGDAAVAVVILCVAVVGCFGINSEMVVRQFPQLAAVLHLTAPARNAALPSGANAQVKVWVDLNTALYYCRGTEFYGRTKNGRYLSQVDARLANFEPAERRECTAGSSATLRKGD
ncbi:MAG TPA: hypothetical protein VL155_14755 [Terriglobales bacterium]|jgi:hypothetical protein|nr:hypothetical protein [Terriglobales bacterium]